LLHRYIGTTMSHQHWPNIVMLANLDPICRYWANIAPILFASREYIQNTPEKEFSGQLKLVKQLAAVDVLLNLHCHVLLFSASGQLADLNVRLSLLADRLRHGAFFGNVCPSVTFVYCSQTHD